MRSFVVLGATLLIAVAMLVYAQSRMSAAGPSVPAVVYTDVARPDDADPARIAGLFQGALMNVEDGVDFAETPGYRRLLYHLRQIPPAEFSQRIEGHLDWEDALAHPDRWRGVFVRARGLIAEMGAVRLHQLDAGIEDVYRGFLAQHDGSGMTAFDCVDPQPELALNKDVVDVEGVFYRTVRYESRDGTSREVPYLIVRNLSVYAPAGRRDAPGVLALKLGGAVLGSIALAFIAVRWGARRRRKAVRGPGQAGFREMFEARLRDDQQRPGGSSGQP